MRISIEFYRIRETDGAHAVVGRDTSEAADLGAALETARRLSETLDLPQRPDAVTISDGEGRELYSGRLEIEHGPL